MQKSVFSDFYCLSNKLALMGRSPGLRPFQRYRHAGKKTVSGGKNRCTWSESIGKTRFRPMYAGANMGHPSSPVRHWPSERILLYHCCALKFVQQYAPIVEGGGRPCAWLTT